MKILIVSQYFFPESFRINDIALGLKERGHDVSVLTGIPNYPKGRFYENYSFWRNNDEEWNDVKIYRSKLFPRGSGNIRLMLNYFSFSFFGCLKVLFLNKKFDKILVYEPSPITVGIPAMFASKKFKTPYFFWVQDLWPESLAAAGNVKNKFLLSFFNYVTKVIYDNSKKILIQSQGFKEYILKQGNYRDKIIYYPNSAEEFYKPLHPNKEYLSRLPKGFKILFAGNLGEAQGISTLIEAAKIVKLNGYDINWVFLGDGRQKDFYLDEVKKHSLESNFFFLGSFPAKEMPYYFACADALVVSLKRNNIFSLTIPSKIQSYLACNKPILGSLDGEGARVIAESKAGFSAPSENPDAFADIIIKFYNLCSDEKTVMANNSRIYFNLEFEREMLLDKLINILNE